MKNILTLLLVIIGLNVSAQFFEETDKQMHIAVSFQMQTVLQVTGSSYGKAAAISLGVGVAKELYDYHSYGVFDKRDIQADLIGIGTAILFDFAARKLLKLPNKRLFGRRKPKLKRCYL